MGRLAGGKPMSALPSPAMYEERIRLLEAENQRLREALLQVADGRTTLEAQRIALEVLQRLGIPLADAAVGEE